MEEEDEPVSLGLLFHDPVKEIKYEISNVDGYMYGAILGAVATVSLLTTAFLLFLTYLTSTADGMKGCEKLLVCNMLVPDLLLELTTLYFIVPATVTKVWPRGVKTTEWLAFLHTFCIFHPHIATATVCFIIALSVTDAYRFEMSRNMKNMLIVVISNLSVSICLCSLPVIEEGGYGFQDNWLSPSFNTRLEYGRIFMCSGLISVTIFVELKSVLRLFEARGLYNASVNKVTKRQCEELDSEIVFVIISVVFAAMTIPAAIGMPDVFMMFPIRIVLYITPLFRALALLNYCPHFQFAFFGWEGADDFLALQEFDIDARPEPLKPMATTVMEETASGIHLTTEL